MAKDIKNSILIDDGSVNLVFPALELGKTVRLTVEKGEGVTKSLASGYSDHFKANVELLEDNKPGCGTCGCGKPANAIIVLWR